MLYLSFEDFSKEIFGTDSDELSLSLSTTSSSEAARLSDEFIPFSFDLFKEESTREMDRCGTLAARHPFFDYAAKHWASHFERSNASADPELHELAASICNPNFPTFHNWFRYYWLDETLSKGESLQSYSTITATTSVASFFGFNTTLKHVLNQ
jgi:hypothetical protein